MQPIVNDWVSKIRKGDILKGANGVLRVVRKVNHYAIRRGSQTWTRTTVYFTIRSCSWTRACYTVLNGSDLRQRGFRPTGARMRLTAEADRIIEADFAKIGAERHLTCCDVEGVG